MTPISCSNRLETFRWRSCSNGFDAAHRRRRCSGRGRSFRTASATPRATPTKQYAPRIASGRACPIGKTETLTQMKCVACRRNAPTLADAEIAELHPQIPDWEIVELDGIKRLRRVFSVDDFAQALKLTTEI